MNESKLTSKILLFFTLFSGFHCVAVAETLVTDFYSVDWIEQGTKVLLPEPFGLIEIIVSKTGEKPNKIWLVSGDRKIEFASKLLGDIEKISEPEFSYDRIDFDSDKKIDHFKIFFEYGYPKIVRLGDTPGCKAPCTESVRDIVVFTVNTDYKITREFKIFDLDL